MRLPARLARQQAESQPCAPADLRWGLTEAESTAGMTSVLCLNEVSRCDIVLGILGSRYGWIPADYGVPARGEFAWVKDYSPGRSITELEIAWGVLNKANARAASVKQSLFYFREEAFLQSVPPRLLDNFVDGSYNSDLDEFTPHTKAQGLLEMLKVKVRRAAPQAVQSHPPPLTHVALGQLLKAAESRTDVHVQPPYACAFNPHADHSGSVGVSGLATWEDQVFHDLCKAIEAVAPAGARRRSEAEVARFAHAAFAHNRAQDVHGRDREVDRVLSLCTDGVVSPAHGATSSPEPDSACDLPAREVLVAGEPGVGKSSILACVFTVRAAPKYVVSAPNH